MALVARPFLSDPLTDVGRATLEFNAVRFGLCQKRQSVAVDEFYPRKCDSNDLVSVEFIANDLQIFRREPTTDAQEYALLCRNSVDSTRHGSRRLSFDDLMANGAPFECDGKIRDRAVRSLVNLADLVNVVNSAKLVEVLAKLELRLINTQRLNAMVKRGGRNAKLRRGSGPPRDAATGCGERRFDNRPFLKGLALRGR